MGKRAETPMERLKSVKLWQWGLLVICAGIFSYAVTGVNPTPTNTAEGQAQALGRAAASIFFVVTGVVLIIVHFARGKR